MKKSPHQWPTDGATRKYVDRANDRLTARIDRQTEKIRALTKSLRFVEDLLVQIHGERRR